MNGQAKSSQEHGGTSVPAPQVERKNHDSDGPGATAHRRSIRGDKRVACTRRSPPRTPLSTPCRKMSSATGTNQRSGDTTRPRTRQADSSRDGLLHHSVRQDPVGNGTEVPWNPCRQAPSHGRTCWQCGPQDEAASRGCTTPHVGAVGMHGSNTAHGVLGTSAPYPHLRAWRMGWPRTTRTHRRA